MNSNGYSIICFLIGSIFGLINAIWDILWDELPGDDDDAAMHSSSSAHTYFYQATLILSPLFYLMEAVFDISAAESMQLDTILFGTGAICELIAASLDQTGLVYSQAVYAIQLISTHAYVFNVAILLIMDHQRKGLIFCGNVIFGIGASIDVILSYGVNWGSDAWTDNGNLVSALCWFLDALVYLAAWKLYDNDDDSSDDNDSVATLAEPLLSPPVALELESSTGSSIRHRGIAPSPNLAGLIRTQAHTL